MAGKQEIIAKQAFKTQHLNRKSANAVVHKPWESVAPASRSCTLVAPVARQGILNSIG